jgi:hydroxypyruvate reductase
VIFCIIENTWHPIEDELFMLSEFPTTKKIPPYDLLEHLWLRGAESVRGRASVSRFFTEHKTASMDPYATYSVVAFGKAAADMMLGAIDVLGDSVKSGLVLTKYAHLNDEVLQYKQITCHESAHPVPDKNSLIAGDMLVNYVRNIPRDHKVVMLVSGGASSLVEVLMDNCSLDVLQKLNEWALQNGLSISEINYMRQKVSLIKGGKLCQYFHQQMVECLYISDVPGDHIHVIGSGPLYAEEDIASEISSQVKKMIDRFLEDEIHIALQQNDQPVFSATFTHNIIANNAIAKNAVKKEADILGFPTTIMNDSIDLDYRKVASIIAEKMITSKPGIYIWGGEPTVQLPKNPGDGGRNQALALLLSIKLKGLGHVSVIVGGTDGTDGPTDAAGAIVDGRSFQKAIDAGFQPEIVLEQANAYHCLKATGDLFSPGPTGTNVMDLIVVIIGDENQQADD